MSVQQSTDLVPIPVPGTDREIVATVIDGKPMVSLRHACDAIGIDPESQRRKLRRRSWAVAVQKTATGTDGKSYEMTMIDRRTFTYWLGGLDENKVSAEAKPVLVKFQAEAADALDAYFNEGGAINPRATEDQLDALARKTRMQIDIIHACKGIIAPAHLEAKARVVLARVMGEAPELDSATQPLYVWDYLSEKMPRSLVEAKAAGFGTRVKAAYTREYQRAPERHHQTLPNGTVRPVNAYTEADRPMFDSVWAKHYANAVAESALFAVKGGAS